MGDVVGGVVLGDGEEGKQGRRKREIARKRERGKG